MYKSLIQIGNCSLLIGMAFILCGPVYAELFKWRDAEGNLIYSDQPPPGNTKQDTEVDKVDKDSLPQIISVPAPELSSSTSASNSTETEKKVERYLGLSIVEPVHDTAVRENSGKVKITVRVEPYIFVERGHILVIYMDNQEVSRGQQTSVMLDNVDRGTHTIKAAIINARGQVIKETGITSFTLQRFHI